MHIATFAYQQLLRASRGGLHRNPARLWAGVRRTLIRLLADPDCTMEVHGRRLQMPLSHELPRNLLKYPLYDQLLGRVSDYYHERQDRLTYIDVGANVGDTLAAVLRSPADQCLVIEPNPHFVRYLRANWGQMVQVQIVEEVCSSTEGVEKFQIHQKFGTAEITPADQGLTLRRRTLDQIVQDFPFANHVNFLKVDTDGHDLEVLAGAGNLIRACQPAVLFECLPGDDVHFVTTCLNCLSSFREAGYQEYLVYSNVGDLMGRFRLDEPWAFRNVLLYQLTGELPYCDVLLMPPRDLPVFFTREADFFIGRLSSPRLQQQVRPAAA
jgi:FkbM family methyltransferase